VGKADAAVPLSPRIAGALPGGSPWPRQAVRFHRPGCQTWARAMAQRAAARACLVLGWRCPAPNAAGPDAAAAKIEAAFRARGPGKAAVSSASAKTLRPPASPPDGWTPGTLALGHGEQAFHPRAGGPVGRWCGLAGHRTKPPGAPGDRSAFSCGGHLTGGRTARVASRSQAVVELPAGKRSCSVRPAPEARRWPPGPPMPAGPGPAGLRNWLRPQRTLAPETGQVGEQPRQPPLDGQFQGNGIGAEGIELGCW